MKMIRICDGIFSVLMARRIAPVVRFQKGSQICQLIAEKVNRLTKKEKNSHFVDFKKEKSLLMILDRREDPVTPLLNQ